MIVQTPIRLGIVGPGLIWDKAHRPVLEELSDLYRISAFSATSQRSREKVAREYPGAPFFADYHDLVRSPDIDAVVVLTPIPLNAPVGMAALEAGKHVFLEKPMGTSLREGEELARVARGSGRRLFVLEQDGYRAVWARMHEVISSGDLGELVMYDRVSHGVFDAGAHANAGYGHTTWRRHPEFPLGTLWDGGHHEIAALARLFGPPAAVTAHGYRARAEFGEYDQVLMLFEYPGTLRGVFSHSSYLGGGRNYMNVRGSEGLVFRERGRLVVRSRVGDERAIPLPDDNPHLTMWRDLVTALVEGTEPPYTIDDGLRELRTLDAIARSAHEGRRVTLEWEGRS